MTRQSPKPQRCAIYTRKSTDHNLDLSFNSLHAQREACEAYIKSQAHEGWTLVQEAFDDGAFSGASLERPALQALLNHVKARQVDIIIVYKVDRLTRSLADFAKLVELFDAYQVSFVSITQSFNTTSSMGRLTLNVLLSFAQFEREVIGERVRDKIAASKRKGLWVGGPVPLGYRSINKALQIAPEEASLVRLIFSTYLQCSSISALACFLNDKGIRPKDRHLVNSTVIKTDHFRVGPLAYLLNNRFYIGEITYRGEIYQGQHDAIIDRDLFEAVQSKLKDQAVTRTQRSGRTKRLLNGKIFDDRGHAMSPTHANKKGVRYRYYTSQALLQGNQMDAGSVSRVSAPDIEAAILNYLRAQLPPNTDIADQELADQHLQRIDVKKDYLMITLKTQKGQAAAGDALIPITLPFYSKKRLQKGIIQQATPDAQRAETDRITLITTIARSKKWIKELLEDPGLDFAAIAKREKLSERYVRTIATLAYVSPKIIEALSDGQTHTDLTLSQLIRPLPLSWAQQDALLRSS